eukprot:5281932-Prymnesium_polylepis.1
MRVDDDALLSDVERGCRLATEQFGSYELLDDLLSSCIHAYGDGLAWPHDAEGCSSGVLDAFSQCRSTEEAALVRIVCGQSCDSGVMRRTLCTRAQAFELVL